MFSGTVRAAMKYSLKSGEETSNPCGSSSSQSSKEFSSPSFSRGNTLKAVLALPQVTE